MRLQIRFPIRLKIMVALLFVITSVVSLITFTMGRLFNQDKTAYIHDLTSLIALHTAEEARSQLQGYRERLLVFGGVMYEQGLTQAQKDDLLKKFFEDFQEFVAVTLDVNGAERATVYDAHQLVEAGLDRGDLATYRLAHPLPMDRIRAGEAYVENSTLSDKLLSLTLAIPYPISKGTDSVTLAAVIRLDGMLRLASRSKAFETLIIDGQGALLAHTDPGLVVTRTAVPWVPNVQALGGPKTLGTTQEYVLYGKEMVGGFAGVHFGGLLAGVQIPKTAAYLTARELLNNLILVALALLVASALLGLFWANRITRPIEEFSMAARVVAKGQFDIHLKPASRDEIGELADSFNQMTSELKGREQALQDAQSALIQSEKLAALGQFSAGIAHEVRNPLAGILAYAQLALRKLKPTDSLFESLEIIEKETKRCTKIMENLLKFSRQEKVQFQITDVNRVVEDTAALADHQLGLHKVRLEKALEPNLPAILGDANQLEQVLMNLLINAQQALEGQSGSVKIATRLAPGDRIEIQVRDTGPGIPEEIQAKIFEPFFTTKPAGKGTGLGLSVSYGIIKNHKGEIRVESGVGQGTTFTISLPTPRAAEVAAVAGGKGSP